VALARPRRGADDLGQKRLGRGVAMQHAVLAAFLVIDDELDGHKRAARPFRVRRILAIAAHVSLVAHTPPSAGTAAFATSEYQRRQPAFPRKFLKVFLWRFASPGLMHGL
jgi:hypothetical protein